MHEQLLWEMPEMESNKDHSRMCLAKHMFKHISVGRPPCNRTHAIDLRQVEMCLEQALIERQARTNYVIFNIGPWWFAPAVGTVIDEQGLSWSIAGSPRCQEWEIGNATIPLLGGANQTTAPTPPNVTFAGCIERVVQMMLRLQSANAVLVCRSEGHADCNPVGSSCRGAITQVLTKHHIPILNISQADKTQRWNGGGHACFPSVGVAVLVVAIPTTILGLTTRRTCRT